MTMHARKQEIETAAPSSHEGNASLFVCGEHIQCDWSGCMYWQQENVLVVSDLHLEKGSSFARKGSFVPPYDTATTLERLAARILYWQPQMVISLGDSFHDPFAHERLTSQSRETIAQLMRGRDWIWISGNHDPIAPVELGGISASQITLGPLTFRHEPAAGLQEGEIAGHLHPAGKINRRSKSVRRPCFVSDGKRLIMPSFGAYTGGLNIRNRAFSGLFEEDKMSAVLLGRQRVFHIAARNLVA